MRKHTQVASLLREFVFHFVDTYDHHTIPIHVSDTSMIICNRQLHKLLSHLADSEAQ